MVQPLGAGTAGRLVCKEGKDNGDRIGLSHHMGFSQSHPKARSRIPCFLSSHTNEVQGEGVRAGRKPRG